MDGLRPEDRARYRERHTCGRCRRSFGVPSCQDRCDSVPGAQLKVNGLDETASEPRALIPQ